ncbi:hypothetical protein [Gilvimarinus sp. DA14]|uniref:hypothetical protein n=1 Tax=Gilvimarinus sp. DA14 TaxID=2956798 RepID=UPI0020B63CBC|nr:hypothetical protein [Gilvimarinus sp. DA14]UTF58813.1 hypothetical protein NHM04_10005 [Gilvimarinus sp. DA14]
MHLFSKLVIISGLLAIGSSASAGPRQMGTDFRTMQSNYSMLDFISQKCPDYVLPEVIGKPTVEKEMQTKIGIQSYIQFMIAINKSDLKKNAQDTIDTLFNNIEGCEDPKLDQAVERIASVHAQAYERFHAEQALVKPNAVPVPMRR